MSDNSSSFTRLLFFGLEEHPLDNNQYENTPCILCNQVFSDSHSFIRHIDYHYHIAEQSLSLRDSTLNPLPNFPRPLLIQETMHHASSSVFQTSPPPPPPMVMSEPTPNPFSYTDLQVSALPPHQHPPQFMVSTGMRNNVLEISQLQAPTIHQRDIDMSPTDATKSYIEKLDKPIDNNVSANIDDEKLNLTLRL